MKQESIQKLPRKKRVLNPPRMRLTYRDKKIIFSVYENRYLRRDQIERLFSMTTTVCNRRLVRLYQHGYLERLYIPVTFGWPQAVYILDRKGVEIVAKELGIDKEAINWKKRNVKVEFLFLDHALAISEFRVCLELTASKRKEIEILFWKQQGEALKDRVSDPDGRQKYLPLTPDAFFGILSPKGKSYFFLEVDLGTQSLKRFKKKIVAYRQYWKSGKYQEKYSFKSFRVLTVTTSEKRLKNLIVAARECGSKSMFLFTIQDLAKPNKIFEKIWFLPVSYDSLSIID